MSIFDKNPDINIWQLVHLGQELDEITINISLLAAQFHKGNIDYKLIEDTRRQIMDCNDRLDKIFNCRPFNEE